MDSIFECWPSLERMTRRRRRKEPEVFSRFRVLKDCRVTFVVDGTIQETRQIFRYVLDWDGQFKIFRYYDSD